MKRIFLLSIILFSLTGCTSIKKMNIDNIINNGLKSNVNITNTNRLGYRYYIPRGLVLKSSDNYNEVILSDKYTYYLYVDIVSYHNKSDFKYEENPNAFYSKKLEKGYIEINNYKKNQYLVEIMNNYAKIEVIVNVEDIKISVANAIAILSSIAYNDNIIDNYLKNKEFNSTPVEFNIFEVIGKDNYIEFTNEEDLNGELKDPDYIR